MESSVRHIIAIGENASLIEQACGMTGIKITAMQTLSQAVQAAWRYALKQQKKNEEWNMLFSPGAASFDMFRNYKERGREFNKIVKGLKI